MKSRSAHAATSLEALRDLLQRWDPAAGPDGFEGLVAQALASVTGYTFRLARSGSQFGRDAASPNAPFSIAMEAKRYSSTVPLEALVGKSTLASFALADGIDVWALAATVEVSEPTLRTLEQILDEGGISLLALDWGEAGLPALAVLLASAKDDVLAWSHGKLRKADHSILKAGLNDISSHPAFASCQAEVLAQLDPGLVGLGAFQKQNSIWCKRHFSDRRLAQREFAQFLAPLVDPAQLVDRPAIMADLKSAIQAAELDDTGDTFVAILGEEGTGKSWAVANWWLELPDRPILLLSVGRIADQLAPGEPPLDLLARLASYQEGKRDDLTRSRWRRRLARWSEKDAGRARFALVLDGLNETSGKAWATILLSLLPAVRELGGVVITTCRKSYWDREVKKRLSIVTIREVPLNDYNDAEFSELLAKHNVPLVALTPEMDAFMRNPRICALALRLNELTGIEDLSVERLLAEYWRNRLRERGDLLGHDDVDFEKLLIKHARDYRERPGTLFDRDDWKSRSGAASRDDGRNLANDLSDIEEGRFFEPVTGGYRFRKEALAFALGLLVADELRDAMLSDGGNTHELLERIIAPVRSFDFLADILTAAIAVASHDADYPDHGVETLTLGWTSLQNVSDDNAERLVPFVEERPVAFLNAFEQRDRESDFRFVHLLMAAADRAPVAQAIDTRLNRWLGTWSRASEDWGNPSEQKERSRKRNERIDRQLAAMTKRERQFFNENCPETEEPLGLNGTAAFYLLGRRQEGFAKAIVAFSFTHVVAADYRSGYEEIAWAIRLNRLDHEALAAAVRAELAPFLVPDASPVARSAAACALRLLGSLTDQLKAESLDPPSSDHSRGSQQIDPLDPDAEEPEGTEAVLARLQEIDPQIIWNHMSSTIEDHELDRRLTYLARFDPTGLMTFLDRVAATISSRTDMPIRQLSWHLPWLSAILSEETVAAVVRRIHDIGDNPSIVPEGDQNFITAMLVEGVFPGLDADAQLDLLQSLPEDAPFYLRYDATAKELRPGTAAERLRDLREADASVTERTLLFLAASAEEPNDELRAEILACLYSTDDRLRAAAAEYIRRHNDAALDNAILTLSIPEFDHGSWRKSVIRSAVASAIARRGREDLIEQIPLEHLDWVAARLPAAIPWMADAIEAAIDRLLAPITTQAVSSATVILDVDVDGNEIDTRIDLAEIEEIPTNPLEALNDELADKDGSRFSNRRKLMHDELDRFLEGLARENAIMLAQRPFMIGLAELARLESARFGGWLRRILAITDQHVLRRLRNLGTMLAQNFAEIDPELSAQTFAALWELKSDVTVVVGRAKLPMRDLALFKAPSSPEIDKLRERSFNEARDDARIQEIALAAEVAGSSAWLDSFVKARIASPFPADQALALTIASFRPPNPQSDSLLDADWAEGFIGIAAQNGLERYRRAKYAVHWLDRARQTQDPRECWRFLELAIAAADKRHILNADPSLAYMLRVIGADAPQRFNKAAEAASKEAGKTLLGSRKLSGLIELKAFGG